MLTGERTVDRELLERRARGGNVFFHGRELDVRERAVEIQLLERLADSNARPCTPTVVFAGG